MPAELEDIFEVKLTEVMSVGCPSAEGAFTAAAVKPILEAAERAAAVVLGPGIGRSPATVELVRELAGRIEAPMVIDADALNALAGRLELVADRASPTVLTPHAGELARLLEIDSGEVGERRLHHATEAAERANAIVVLKGDDTIVAAPGAGPIVNGLSSPALATAGTGDVLSGMTAALVARGLEPRAAAPPPPFTPIRAPAAWPPTAWAAAESVIATDVIAAIPDGLVP